MKARHERVVDRGLESRKRELNETLSGSGDRLSVRRSSRA